jgi:hypothetical protein
VTDHEEKPARAQIMSNLPKQPAGRQEMVTVAQRGYSLRLRAVYTAKQAGGCFLKRTARPAYALRNGIPEAVSQGS